MKTEQARRIRNLPSVMTECEQFYKWITIYVCGKYITSQLYVSRSWLSVQYGPDSVVDWPNVDWFLVPERTAVVSIMRSFPISYILLESLCQRRERIRFRWLSGNYDDRWLMANGWVYTLFPDTITCHMYKYNIYTVCYLTLCICRMEFSNVFGRHGTLLIAK